jgi:hypothetical protein
MPQWLCMSIDVDCNEHKLKLDGALPSISHVPALLP